MRKQLLSVFLPLLLMGLTASAADTSQRNELQHVNVVRGTDEIRLEISARGAVTPKLTTADTPARLILDLPATVMATRQTHITVDSADVKGVRIGMDGQTPPTTRLVVDLEHSCRYDLSSQPNGKIVLTLHTGSPKTAGMVAPKVPMVKTVADNPALVSRQASPFAPRAAEAKAVASNEVAANVQPAMVNAPAASNPAPANGKPVSATNDYVFVEPTYSAKSAAADASTQPADRAGEAAAKFADKTAPELLPASMNAAQSSQSAGAGITPAVNLAAEQKAQAGQQPASAGPKYTGEPISVNLKDVDLKDFFRLVHEISGLNVVLDPNVHGTLTVVLDDVPWDQALDIVLKNNDLARELEGNVLRIATVDTLKKEAEGRRAQVEAEAMAVEKVSVTRFLSYAHSKDVLVTVKKFLSMRGDAVADERTNAIIVNDIPKVIPVIDRLLTQLDRKTQEVEI